MELWNDEVKEKMLSMFDHLTPRDPKRIKRMLNIIEEIWMKHPDQRFFQLLENIFGCQKLETQCFFNKEDDVTEERLDEFLKTGMWRKRK